LQRHAAGLSSNCSVPEIASITGHSMIPVQEILDAHYLGSRVELAESAIKKLSEVYGQGQKRVWGCGAIPGEGVTRSPRLLRERALHAAGIRGSRCGNAQPSRHSLSSRQIARVRMANKNSQLKGRSLGWTIEVIEVCCLTVPEPKKASKMG
jgi:hypothetical protein